MSFLHEIAVKAKWDGSFTEEWAIIRKWISLEGCLRNVPGKSDIEKLKGWAEREGLLMDFNVECGSFSSEIRSVTFWNGRQAVGGGGAGRPVAAEEPPSAEGGEVVGGGDGGPVGAAVENTIEDDLDRRSRNGTGGGDAETWRALSGDVDYVSVGGLREMRGDDDAGRIEDATTNRAMTG